MKNTNNSKPTLFLDLDGVIATHKEFMMSRQNFMVKHKEARDLGIPYPFNPRCVKILNEILEETGADIVLSSDWKKHWNLEELDKIFKFNGVIKSPIGVTKMGDILSLRHLEKNRAYEIESYINDNKIEKYVIIDDLNIGSYMGSNANKFILTQDTMGLKQTGIKQKILNVLM